MPVCGFVEDPEVSVEKLVSKMKSGPSLGAIEFLEALIPDHDDDIVSLSD